MVEKDRVTLAGFGWSMSERGEEANERIHTRIAIVPRPNRFVPKSISHIENMPFSQEFHPIRCSFVATLVRPCINATQTTLTSQLRHRIFDGQKNKTGRPFSYETLVKQQPMSRVCNTHVHTDTSPA